MKLARKPVWYLRRLQAMSAAEIVWRVSRALRSRYLARFYRNAATPAARIDCLPHHSVLLAADAPRSMPVAPLPDWLQQGFPLFETRWPLDKAPDWLRDPKTGVSSPRATGFFIDYRNASLVGDIKYLWEPARFHACVPLAQAWRASGEQRYLDAIALQLDSFLEQCPCPVGVHWASALESAIRLLNWALVWELTGGRESPLLQGAAGAIRQQRWLESIYWHQHFIHHYYAAYSSANNHLIGEAAGVYVASSVWPLWNESAGWQQRARATLERECLAQNHPDGVNAEQALCYQQFVWDFLCLPLLVAQRQQQPFSDAYQQRLHRMVVFLAALQDGEGGWPQIGDADDGLATGLSAAGVTANYASILAGGAVLFNDAALADAGRWDDKNNCLLGEQAKAAWQALRLQTPEALPTAFPDGGYYRLGNHLGLCAWLDAGPLGLGELAAHGHADALQLLLWARGVPVLVDPGTYAYHTEQRWRDYFRGTPAHNTVTLDDCNQSVIGGNFLWMEKAIACCAYHDDSGSQHRFSGYHEGYQRLVSPVHHERDAVLDIERQQLVVTDRLQGNGEHQVLQTWHFDPRWQPALAGNCLALRLDDQAVLHMQLDETLQWALVRGNEVQPMGWYSRKLDQREPCVSLVGRGSIHGDTRLETVIRLANKESA